MTAFAPVAVPRPAIVPAQDWESWNDPAEAGFAPVAVAALEEALHQLPTTSLMVVRGGRVAYSYGDIAEPSYLASARKSVISMLYGPHVAAGTIDLGATLLQLGIDDVTGLLPIEKQATIGDILCSCSGVYYPAGSPGGDMQGVPPRGSQRPGTYFHYNNWDFNVAGAIFTQLTGRSVFDALEDQLATPLRFQDFDRQRQRMLGYPDQSRFLAYHMFLSARDMARIGLLALRGGNWAGRELVPAEWMRESTRTHVWPSEMHGRFRDGGSGYGYYWWTPQRPGQVEWNGAFLASGHFGQFILCLPALDTVIVHRRAVSDEKAMARNAGLDMSEVPSVSSTQLLKLAELLLRPSV